MKYKKLAHCRCCEKEIDEKMFISISSILLDKDMGRMKGEVSWVTRHSQCYCKSCTKKLFGDKFVEEMVNPEIEEDEWEGQRIKVDKK